MCEEVLTGELWARLEPLIPVRPRRFEHPGRKRVEDRAVLEGILCSVRVGIGWNRLPAGLFGASGASGARCWRRLAEWQQAGVWQRLHEALLAEPRAVGMSDLSAALLDSTRLRAGQRGDHVGPSPVDRGKPGSKHPLITDAHGTPLAVTLTGGDRDDVTRLIPLIDAIPPIRGVVGKPKQRPRRLYADRGHDHDKYRRLARARGITPHIARRGVAHGSGLGVKHWPVEHTLSWLKNSRRLRIRTERRADVHQAILTLACSIICLRKLILN
ncbi:IS5 family transposase [Actinokineospora sp. G85]|uniref:IS5 family transposase n=1 Tax=Actinokineospora sp. G85 TaxID=3406626 RepID=UPI003C72EFE9